MSALELLAYLAPVLALLCALALGRYPGERALRRRLPRRRSARRLRAALAARPRPPRLQGPRGGALLAYALAGRAPPAPV
jgi:hypothetical protein